MKPKDIVRIAMMRSAELLRAEAKAGEPPAALFDMIPAVRDEQVERWRLALRDLADQLERKAEGRGRRIG